MARDLHEKVGAVEYEKLFAGIEPPALVRAGTIAHGAAKAEYKRGSLMAKGADGKLHLLGSDVDATGTFSGTGNGTTTKFSLVDGGVIPTSVQEVKVDGTALTTGWTYNATLGELEFATAPANTKTVAVKYTTGGGGADCILTDDVEVGTTADVVATVYITGNFNIGAVIVADDYTITEADKDELRKKGILFGTVQAL